MTVVVPISSEISLVEFKTSEYVLKLFKLLKKIHIVTECLCYLMTASCKSLCHTFRQRKNGWAKKNYKDSSTVDKNARVK